MMFDFERRWFNKNCCCSCILLLLIRLWVHAHSCCSSLHGLILLLYFFECCASCFDIQRAVPFLLLQLYFVVIDSL